MERSSPPLFNSFQTILGSLVIDLFLPQKHRQNVLIDRIIYMSARDPKADIPSTIKTLMGGTTESCPVFFAGAAFFLAAGFVSLKADIPVGFTIFGLGIGCPAASLLPGPTTLVGDKAWMSREPREVVVVDRSRPMAKMGSELGAVGVGRVLRREAARDNVGVSFADPRRDESSFDCLLWFWALGESTCS
jgi:hypothetical protein